jgi:hypothetical protein
MTENMLVAHYEDVDNVSTNCFYQLKKDGLVTNMVHNSLMMREIIQGVEYASAVYKLDDLCSKLPDTAMVKVLSHDENDATDPNCIALYDYERDCDTIWVVARGSVRAFDWVMNFSFLALIDNIGNLAVPKLPKDHADNCINGLVSRYLIINLLRYHSLHYYALILMLCFIICLDRLDDFMEDLISTVSKAKRVMPKRIGFAGHSLGGAIATTSFLKYNVSTKPEDLLDSFVINLNGPTVFYQPGKALPESLQLNATSPKVPLVFVRDRIHNIVQQHDLIPRIVGPHALPEIYQGGIFSTIFGQLKNTRDNYRCVGQHYFLNPKHSSRKGDIFQKIGTPYCSKAIENLMSCWPSMVDHIPMLINDHKHCISLAALVRIMNASGVQYKQVSPS